MENRVSRALFNNWRIALDRADPIQAGFTINIHCNPDADLVWMPTESQLTDRDLLAACHLMPPIMVDRFKCRAVWITDLAIKAMAR